MCVCVCVCVCVSVSFCLQMCVSASLKARVAVFLVCIYAPAKIGFLAQTLVHLVSFPEKVHL